MANYKKAKNFIKNCSNLTITKIYLHGYKDALDDIQDYFINMLNKNKEVKLWQKKQKPKK